jgi:hypothetical protein
VTLFVAGAIGIILLIGFAVGTAIEIWSYSRRVRDAPPTQPQDDVERRRKRIKLVDDDRR